MALIAGRRHMRAKQRKARFVVIERHGLPRTGGVAARAVVREICRRVIRVGGALKICLMTREAIHRRAGEAIIDMTQITWHSEMRARQRKARAIMIKRRRPPSIVIVARQTIMRIIAGDMIRIRCRLKIRLMAREAVFRRAGKAAIDVALCTFNRPMRAEQWKSRTIVIERRGLPCIHSMALRTSVREISGQVIRIRRFLISALMARKTIHRRSRETIVHMTLIARHGRMHTEQWETRAAVIELAESRHLPAGNRAAVTLLTIRRKTRLLMIRIRRGRIILLMTSAALQRQIDELRRPLPGVTIIAAHVLVQPH
jgi:hypothetical protein